MLSRLSIRIVHLKFMESFQSVIEVFLNIFSHIITFLLTKVAQDCVGRILALLGTLVSFVQNSLCLGPIFSYPRTWLKRNEYNLKLYVN